jgi:shikimate kinase
LLRTDNPHATLVEIADVRNPTYALAEIFVEADEAYSIEDMVARVVAKLLSVGVLKETRDA